MGIRSTRPLPLAHAELALAPFFKRRFRSWHLEHVRLALQRYRLLTTRFCVDALQLSAILSIKEKKLVDDVMRLFLPRTPTRVQCMVDAMEVLIALVLVCQAPSMLQRFELIFDIVDLEAKGAISTMDLIMLCGAVGRAIMKLFEYKVEPAQDAAMAYVTDILDSLGVSRNSPIAKEALCKFMVTDRYAVHYVKQCTGNDKPKLYIMMEKDAEFLGAIEFSNEQHMRTTSLRAVRDMINAQVHRVPEDFLFLCQGREVEKLWEVDRRAWSIVPFALRGSPGLRTDILATNRRLERPAISNPFEFRYMGNLITRYKKFVHEIKPVYRHRAFRLRKKAPRKRLDPVVQWRVATTWSGEWMYEQQLIEAKSKPEILKLLRTAIRPQQGVLMVKSHFGEILSPSSVINFGGDDASDDRPSLAAVEDAPSTPSKPEQRMQRIIALNLNERKREDKLRKERMQRKARVIAMEAQHHMDERLNTRSTLKDTADDASSPNIKTVLVHVEEDNVLPSRLVPCEPKKRPRPEKLGWADYTWDVHGRLISALPPKSKKLKLTKISDDITLATSGGTSTNRQLGLGRFLSSTRIFLEDNKVEVFPVLILRPVEEKICVNNRADDDKDDVAVTSVTLDDEFSPVEIEKVLKKPLLASKTYLTEFEYAISASESNYEVLYQHVASGMLQDAIWLNRHDVLGRTMLHDAAEFGHANVMELLLKTGVIVDTKDSRGDTPLHHAARHGRLKEVSMLLREHATPWILNTEEKSPLYCVLETAGRGLVRSASQPSGKSTESVLNDDDSKNFFLAHRTYPQLRQVIDLLWDSYKLEHLTRPDRYGRANCLQLEKQVFGDMLQACHDGNLLRVQRLVDLEKRPVLRYINDQMEILQRTALHEACEQGHTATVDLLLKLGADGYLRDQRLQTPLHLAACKGYDKIVKCLISKFSQAVAYQDVTGCTPLHLAIQQKHWSIAAELISLITSGGNTADDDSNGGLSSENRSTNYANIQDIHGYTALHYACIQGNLVVATSLVKAGAAVSVSRYEYRIAKGTTNLLGVWWKGDLKHVGNRKSLMESPDQFKPVEIEAPSELLLKGCRQNPSSFQERIAVLDLLLQHESKISDPGLMKVTPSPLYHITADLADINTSISVEICRQLHKLHVEINMAHPQTGETVLLQECKRVCIMASSCSATHDEMLNQLALVRCLLGLGANVDLANEVNGESPLGCAAWYGHLALLDLLLEAGADKNYFLRRSSFSPLHFAALGNNMACAKMLIGRSATINVEMPPTNAEAPLYFAIRSKSAEMVDLLLRSNADPCSLCTVEQYRITSFGVVLSCSAATKGGHNHEPNEGTSGRSTGAVVASPLTFGLLFAQSLKAFCVSKGAVEITNKQGEWIEMENICSMLAKSLLEGNGGSKGVVTREDVHLACVLGFWNVAQILLSQQIGLSNAPSAYGMNALHLAAAAGQTKLVTALVAGGMNVNCITRGDSTKPKRQTGRRTWYEWIGCGHRGALFYALINGHTETAAKLLVLGANVEQTIPHTRKKVRWRIGKVHNEGHAIILSYSEYIVVRFAVSEAMVKAARIEQLDANAFSIRQCRSDHDNMLHVDEASVNLIHLIECSFNQKVPLLHLVVALGHFTLVKVLVEAGMSIFTGFGSLATGQTGMTGLKMPPETPIHLAIACGHLEILKYFGSIVQNHFPGCFIREGKVFKSLLVTACEAHQAGILRFLVSHDGVDRGGGFAYGACKDEFQSALSVCSSVQFVKGFEVLIQYGAKPDVHTLVNILKGITLASKYSMASPRVNEIELLERDEINCRAAFPGERYQHDFSMNSVEVATTLLERTLSREYIGNISEFIGSSPVYELMLKILVICSRYQLWFVLETMLVHQQEYFVDATSIWKPVLVRAANNSLVLHRAAMNNQVNVIAFFLRLGVTANLRLAQAPSISCPIYYAATRGALEAFLCLALHSTSVVEDLEFCRVLNDLPLTFRSFKESQSTLSTSDTTCRWQNLGVFGCIDVSKKQTSGYLIQKFVNYGLMISRGHIDSTLLHQACRRGELIAVQALVDAGANLSAINRKGETPLEVASGRQDPCGIVVVRYLLSVLKHQQIPASANIVDRALVYCFAQNAPCNLRVAKALLDAGANARFFYDGTEDQTKANGVGQISAIFYAMKTAQSAGVNLLLDHGATITVGLSEIFLAQFLMDEENIAQHHWRRFCKYMKPKSGKELLLNVEGIMTTLLKNEVFKAAMNLDLVYQMLTSASAIAATIAQELGESKRFWSIVDSILDKYPKEASSRKGEWNQKVALHYAVASLELPTVTKLLELRDFDLMAEDETKQTPLHVAAVGGDEVICRLMLTKLQTHSVKSTTIDIADTRGRTALHLAVIRGHEAAASMFLAAGASLDIRCRDGLTALLHAAKCNRLAILISLFSRAQSKSHDALIAANGDAGIFVAASHGAFPVVRWFMSLYEEESNTDVIAVFEMQCAFGRTIVHYSAIYGDVETLELLLKAESLKKRESSEAESATTNLQAIINSRDKAGYTPLMYAFAFGRLRVVRMLCELGADPYASVDHSGDPGAHPYTVGFDIAGLLQWFALPGWYSFACKLLPEEKRRLVKATSIDGDCLWHSSYNYRKKRGRSPVEWRCKWNRIPAARLLKSEPRRRGKELVRTSIRSWRFPHKSIFDYACEIGNALMTDFLVKLQLPQLFRNLTYQAQRRNFMQAVRWNRLGIVENLVTSATPGKIAIESTTGNHFLDFLEAGIECAVSRGLEDMAIYLVNHWQGIKGNDQSSATPSAFAFQFASAFQVACIRGLPRLMELMIERGGEEIAEFQVNEGPALTYAFAFGNVKIAALLLRSGADPSIPTATYAVASIRKLMEFGSPKNVRVSWQPRITEGATCGKRPAFVGPLDTYDMSMPRLPIDDLCRTFADISFSSDSVSDQRETNALTEPTEFASNVDEVTPIEILERLVTSFSEKLEIGGDTCGQTMAQGEDDGESTEVRPTEISNDIQQISIIE